MAQAIEQVIDCYDKAARAYADKYLDELSKKHLDRLLLKAFALENPGKMADFGCGPGQTTSFLYSAGATAVVGIDISSQMIEVATQLHPNITFRKGNLLALDFQDCSFQSAIAFYAVVHFSLEQLQQALEEVYRILDHRGEFLFSFHIGTEKIHNDEFLGHEVDIDFYFFEVDTVLDIAKTTGFQPIDVIERQPYVDAEYPSRRAYIWLKKG